MQAGNIEGNPLLASHGLTTAVLFSVAARLALVALAAVLVTRWSGWLFALLCGLLGSWLC